jgi:hypothetical protein
MGSRKVESGIPERQQQSNKQSGQQSSEQGRK